jgi:adenylate cyclase
MPLAPKGMLSASRESVVGHRRQRNLVILALLCYCALYQIDAWQPSFYTRLTWLYRDSLARAGRLTPPNSDLVFLAIDADSVGLDPTTDTREMYGLTNPASIESRAFALMTQRFPWPREIYALILQRLVDAGARAVVFDLTFPKETEGDEILRNALNKYRGQVVIGSNFVDPSWNGPARIGASLTRPPDSLIPEVTPMDPRVGYTNFWPDEDEVVRRAQYRVTFEQVEGAAPQPDTERYMSLMGRAAEQAGYGSFIPPGLETQTFRFTGRPREAFPPHSIFEIFVPEYWQHNYRNGESLRNKIVIVGAEGNWQHDEHQTPLGLMPGPELHLNALNAALHHEFIRELPPATVSLATVLAALLGLVLSLFIRSPWIRLVSLLLADAAGCWMALASFNRFSCYLPMINPLAQLNLSVLLGLWTDFTQERREKNRVRRTLERYVSRDVVGQMLDNPKAYQQSLGGVIKPVTILFSDIRGFTAVTAQSEPHILVEQLNEYLGAMVECVFRFHGTLDKFVGDAVMAVWGNIHSAGTATDATNAVEAARAMGEELNRLNAQWKKRGLPELKAGIAVHHGEVVVGNVGSPRRMEFTVIGEAVNMTWKLQEYTKKAGCSFVMSQAVKGLLGSAAATVSLGPATFGGRDQPIEIFTFAAAPEAPALPPARTVLIPSSKE